MKKWHHLARCPSVAALVLAAASSRTSIAAERPKFIAIDVDDLGYGDIQPYGSMLNRTPNLNIMSPLSFPDEGIENYVKLGLEHNPDMRFILRPPWKPLIPTCTSQFSMVKAQWGYPCPQCCRKLNGKTGMTNSTAHCKNWPGTQ